MGSEVRQRRDAEVQARLDAILGAPPPVAGAAVAGSGRRAGEPALVDPRGVPRRAGPSPARSWVEEEDVDAEAWPDDDALAAAGAGTRSLTIEVPHLTRRHLAVVAVVLALAVLGSGFLLLRARADPVPVPLVEPSPLTVSAEPAPTSSPTPSPLPGVTVHVVGSVVEPGVVRLSAGARVGEAIVAAGGLAEGAEPGRLNLAQVLTDGDQVVVAEVAEESAVHGPSASVGGGTAPADGAGAQGSAGTPLDLNSATLEQLDALPGVGPVTARKILDWRESQGPFTRVAELQEVSGIGPKTYQELEPMVTV